MKHCTLGILSIFIIIWAQQVLAYSQKVQITCEDDKYSLTIGEVGGSPSFTAPYGLCLSSFSIYKDEKEIRSGTFHSKFSCKGFFAPHALLWTFYVYGISGESA